MHDQPDDRAWGRTEWDVQRAARFDDAEHRDDRGPATT